MSGRGRLRRQANKLQRAITGLGPAMAFPNVLEALLASLGAGVALCFCGGMLAWLAAGDARGGVGGLFMIAPLGATAFLLFAVPNSPLAQPWSALVGNGSAGAVAVTILLVLGPGAINAGLAVAAAMLAMAFLRAMHPPGGAVALATMLAHETVLELGYRFVLTPILLDTLLLVAAAVLFHRLTGASYPFPSYPAPGRHETDDADPLLRLGLAPEELTELVKRFRQSTNIGLEDLAELLAAAEEAVASKRAQDLSCGAVMSKDLVAVSRATPLAEVADLFRRHHFKTLPVIDDDDGIDGIISQNDFIQRAVPRSQPLASPLLEQGHRATLRWQGTAEDIMTSPVITVQADTPVGALIPLLADHGVQAVPVTDGRRLVGVVTRSDLLAVLAERMALASSGPG